VTNFFAPHAISSSPIANAAALKNLTMTVVVATICLAITWVTVTRMRAAEETEVRMAFDEYSQRLTRDLKARLSSLVHLSRTSAALVEAHPALQQAEWSRYVNGLDPYLSWPGFSGAGVAFLVDSSSHAGATKPTTFKPTTPKKPDQPSVQDLPAPASAAWSDGRLPLTFTEAESELFRHYRGVDLASAPLTRAAIELARDRNEPTLTSPLNSSLDKPSTNSTNSTNSTDSTTDTPRLLLFAPFYRPARPTGITERRQQLAGVVVIGIDPTQLVKDLSEGRMSTRIAFRGADLPGGILFHNSLAGGSALAESGTARFKRTELLNLGGHNWQLDFQSLPEFDKSIDRGQSRQLMVTGLLVTLMLSGLAFYLGRVLRRAQLHTQNVAAQLTSSEVSLARYRDFLASVLDALPDPLVVSSGDDRVRMVNRSFALKAGRSVESLIDSSAYDLFAKELADPFVTLNHKVLQTGEDQRLEITYFDQEMGAHRRMLTHWVRTVGPDGEALVIASSHDVTAVRASEERYRRLSEMASDWFWEQDAEFRFTHMTKGVRVGDLDPLDFLGKHRWDMPIEWTDEQCKTHRAVLESHQPFTDLEYRVKAGDNEWRWYSISGQAMLDPAGVFTGYQGTGRDITERKQNEEELRLHRDKLSEMVDAKTVELRAAVEAAGVAMKAKSEFIANMSHELRTPLHAILSFTQLGLLRTEAAPEKAKGYFERAHQAGERLLVLINNLLDMSKIEAGKLVLDIRPHDLAELARDLVHELEPLIMKSKLSVIAPPLDLTARASFDSTRVSQAIRNLLSNAIKFTPAGKSIYVSIAADVLPQGRRVDDVVHPTPAWRLAVADDGIGLPANELDAIFEKFVQSSKTRSGAGGTGLGLAITREIIEAHHGTIRAYNRPEGGSEFVILIPQTPLITELH